jgi:thiamine kinase-like enzyme
MYLLIIPLIFQNYLHHKNLQKYYLLIISKIGGLPLHYEWNKLEIISKKNISTEIISVLKIIHSVNPNIPNFYETALIMLHHIYKKSIRNPNIQIGEVEKIFEELVFFYNEIKNKTNIHCLVHNDLWYKNNLVKGTKLSGIIDFETAINAPKGYESYRLFQHFFSAKNYIDNGSVDYSELDFLKSLLSEIKISYVELIELFDQEEYRMFNKPS